LLLTTHIKPGSGFEKYMNRYCHYGLLASVVLVLGAGAYVWAMQVLGDPLAAALMALSTWVIVGYPLVLIRRLRLVRVQRDQALAQVSATQWHMCDGLKNQHPCIETCSARRVQTLQSEIADLQIKEQLLQFQAHYDSLTGLANRLLLADRFYFALERAKRSGKPFALFMVDLNDFKAINDQHGHAAGDTVLVTMAKRLEVAVRASDTVARLGGDEFVLIIESIADRNELFYFSRKLSVLLSETITLENGVALNIGASLGFSLYPDDGSVMDDLLDIADHAMYECKNSVVMPLL
jgi:diguanylate cyclase (GGDEF)-like protein